MGDWSSDVSSPDLTRGSQPCRRSVAATPSPLPFCPLRNRLLQFRSHNAPRHSLEHPRSGAQFRSRRSFPFAARAVRAFAPFRGRRWFVASRPVAGSRLPSPGRYPARFPLPPHGRRESFHARTGARWTLPASYTVRGPQALNRALTPKTAELRSARRYTLRPIPASSFQSVPLLKNTKFPSSSSEVSGCFTTSTGLTVSQENARPASRGACAAPMPSGTVKPVEVVKHPETSDEDDGSFRMLYYLHWLN